MFLLYLAHYIAQGVLQSVSVFSAIHPIVAFHVSKGFHVNQKAFTLNVTVRLFLHHKTWQKREDITINEKGSAAGKNGIG